MAQQAPPPKCLVKAGADVTSILRKHARRPLPHTPCALAGACTAPINKQCKRCVCSACTAATVTNSKRGKDRQHPDQCCYHSLSCASALTWPHSNTALVGHQQRWHDPPTHTDPNSKLAALQPASPCRWLRGRGRWFQVYSGVQHPTHIHMTQMLWFIWNLFFLPRLCLPTAHGTRAVPDCPQAATSAPGGRARGVISSPPTLVAPVPTPCLGFP